MKIAIASADEQTISKHFGRVEKYVVYPVENGKVINRKTFPKPGRHRNPGLVERNDCRPYG